MEIGGSGGGMIDSVLRFFVEDQWNYQLIEPGSAVRAGYRGVHGTWICTARAEAVSRDASGSRRFLFTAGMGMNIAPHQRAVVMEYLTRVNCGLPVGGFVMDLDTGDVRFKVGVDVPDGVLTIAMVRAAAYTCVQALDRYFPGLLAVIHGGLSPQAALARVVMQPVEGAASR